MERAYAEVEGAFSSPEVRAGTVRRCAVRRALLVVLAVVMFLAVAGCSSSDPTASDEYAALEQDLAATESDLVAAEANLNAAEQELANVSTVAAAANTVSDGVSQDVGRGPVPDDVVALIDQWKQATESSMVDLYTANGYHLYGTQKFSGDDIGPHLVNPAVTHETLTPLLLVADESGRYVVTQGVENTFGYEEAQSGVSWEIVADSDGTLKIAQSAWLYDNS